MRKRVLLIVGPTASGKTQLSLRMAETCGGEIVSADSRQIYRTMDIGTDKPSSIEMETVSHHCIDIKDPYESFSAGEYGKLARKIISEILARGRIPIVVGGSGLYIRALVDGVFTGNFRDSELRNGLRRKADREGLDTLYNRLCEVDPSAAQKIHPNDQKRIIRALEVFEISGEPISRIQEERTEPADFVPQFWGILWSRKILYERIERRVDEMIQSGLVQEVEKLKEMGFGPEHNSLDSVGYKEVFAYLEDSIPFDEMVNRIKRNTRRFAKKQLTWFRRDPRIRWIELQEPVDWDKIALRIVDVYNRP